MDKKLENDLQKLVQKCFKVRNHKHKHDKLLAQAKSHEYEHKKLIKNLDEEIDLTCISFANSVAWVIKSNPCIAISTF